MTLISRILEWVRGSDSYERDYGTNALGVTLTKSQIQRYKEDYEVREPIKGHKGHDTVWTRAPGVWHCRDCIEWYRTWEDHPSEVEDK